MDQEEVKATGPAKHRSSRVRRWWLLFGAIVVLIVTFDLLENLVGTGSSATNPDVADASPPGLPIVRRADDGAIEIRHDFFHRSRTRTGSEARDGDDAEGWTPRRVRDSIDIPVPPVPPESE